jgi:hypothetical protein
MLLNARLEEIDFYLGWFLGLYLELCNINAMTAKGWSNRRVE